MAIRPASHRGAGETEMSERDEVTASVDCLVAG